MKHMQAPEEHDESVFDPTVKTVIIYDIFDFATKANALLARAARRTNETTRFSVRPWRVDVLKLSPADEEAALAEMAEAHLIVLAVRQVQSHLPWLTDWLERWAACRRIQEAALAVWESGSASTLPPRATPELSQFAGRHGLSLIFNDDALVGDKSLMFAGNRHGGGISPTSWLPPIPEPPGPDCHQHWGIND